MLFRQLQYFVTVVECGSFTEAAERLFISQSAVSQQLQALERELDTTLIIREGRRFSLTAAGRFLYEGGRELLKRAYILSAETSRIGQGSQRTLRVAYLNILTGDALRHAVSEFAGQCGGVALSIRSGTHEELFNALVSGEIDIAINDQRRVFSDEYHNDILCELPLSVELPPEHRLHGCASIDLDQLRHESCVLVASPDQRVTEAAFYRDLIGFKGDFTYADTLEAARLMNAGGQGFLLTLRLCGGQMPEAPVLMRDGEVNRCVVCAFWKKTNDNPYIEPFITALGRYMRR